MTDERFASILLVWLGVAAVAIVVLLFMFGGLLAGLLGIIVFLLLIAVTR